MTTKKILIIAAIIIALLIGVIAILTTRINKVKEERDTQKKNVSTLIVSVEQYKTKDSLQAATVGQLELSLKQFQEYKAEDAKLIETLRVDNNRLQGVVTAQTESYYQHTAALRDSIKILAGNNPDSIQSEIIKTATFSDDWHSLNLVIDRDSVKYKLKTKESLIITNHVIPKRFLGFLWKYGVKEIRTEAISKNPYTEDLIIESITIK